MKVRFPRDVEIPVKLFARYTPIDLIRIGAPATLGYVSCIAAGLPSTMAIAGLGVGAVLGLVWATIQVHGKQLDELLYHFIRFKLGKRSVQDSGVKDGEKR
jgi:mannose/fructose/N-acetylgalactosamine-specific phosphotransferase system component IID